MFNIYLLSTQERQTTGLRPEVMLMRSKAKPANRWWKVKTILNLIELIDCTYFLVKMYSDSRYYKNFILNKLNAFMLKIKEVKFKLKFKETGNKHYNLYTVLKNILS